METKYWVDMQQYYQNLYLDLNLYFNLYLNYLYRLINFKLAVIGHHVLLPRPQPPAPEGDVDHSVQPPEA